MISCAVILVVVLMYEQSTMLTSELFWYEKNDTPRLYWVSHQSSFNSKGALESQR